VHYLDLAIEGQLLRMAYMDVAPAGAANGKTVVLFHGKSIAGDVGATAVPAPCDSNKHDADQRRWIIRLHVVASGKPHEKIRPLGMGAPGWQTWPFS
jgi:hypothetical protein